jgi:hypothetical protein
MEKLLHDLSIARGIGAVERQHEIFRGSAVRAVGHRE